jgi:hypothetical protein
MKGITTFSAQSSSEFNGGALRKMSSKIACLFNGIIIYTPMGYTTTKPTANQSSR